MHLYVLALSLPVKINAQKDPLPVLMFFVVAVALLWFLVTLARRRDARKASGQGRRQDTWSRRPPRY
jgi:hypothetical protein